MHVKNWSNAPIHMPKRNISDVCSWLSVNRAAPNTIKLRANRKEARCNPVMGFSLQTKRDYARAKLGDVFVA